MTRDSRNYVWSLIAAYLVSWAVAVGSVVAVWYLTQ